MIYASRPFQLNYHLLFLPFWTLLKCAESYGTKSHSSPGILVELERQPFRKSTGQSKHLHELQWFSRQINQYDSDVSSVIQIDDWQLQKFHVMLTIPILKQLVHTCLLAN